MSPEFEQFLMAAADFILLAAGFVLMVFWLVYWRFYNWRATGPGRAVFHFVLSLITIVLLIALARFIGVDYWGRAVLRVIVFSYVFATALGLLIELGRDFRRTGQLFNIERRERRTGPVPTIEREDA